MPTNGITQSANGFTIEEDGTYLVNYDVALGPQSSIQTVDFMVMDIDEQSGSSILLESMELLDTEANNISVTGLVNLTAGETINLAVISPNAFSMIFATLGKSYSVTIVKVSN